MSATQGPINSLLRELDRLAREQVEQQERARGANEQLLAAREREQQERERRARKAAQAAERLEELRATAREQELAEQETADTTQFGWEAEARKRGGIDPMLPNLQGLREGTPVVEPLPNQERIALPFTRGQDADLTLPPNRP